MERIGETNEKKTEKDGKILKSKKKKENNKRLWRNYTKKECGKTLIFIGV